MSSPTLFFLVKTIISGLLIAVISTLAKAFPKWAALLTALPLVTFLSLIWIYVEHRDLPLLENYSRDVLLWTLPGLPFFVVLIFSFRARIPFVFSLGLATAVLFLGVFLFNKLGILK
jgi:hypothetical protein